MADTERKGAWRAVSECAVQYLVRTRNIAEWLSDFSVPGKDDADPDFSPLEKLIEERDAIVVQLKEIDSALLTPESVTDDEKMCRKLSGDLMREIIGLEQENEKAMEKFASEYRQKLKNIKQARETMTAYNKTQAYSAAAIDALGHHFNQAN